MRLAALDLGSNSLKLTIADLLAGDLAVVEEAAEVTRIGQNLDQNGYLLDEAIGRTLSTLRRFAERARALGATDIACVATAGLRGASNASAFLERAKKEIDLDIEIIDGLREAELAFQASAAAYAPAPVLVVDIGGRSTELITGAETVEQRVSLEIGSVRLTERFLPSNPPADADLQALRAHVDATLADNAPPTAPEARLVGVSGTVVSLKGFALGLDDLAETILRGEGQPLSRGAIVDALEQLKRVPARDRIRGTVIPPGRADVIVAGATTLLAVLDHYDRDELTVSNRGVRYGLLFERLRDH